MNTQGAVPMMLMDDMPTEEITDGGPVSRPLHDPDIVEHQRLQLRRIMFETTREIPCIETETD